MLDVKQQFCPKKSDKKANLGICLTPFAILMNCFGPRGSHSICRYTNLSKASSKAARAARASFAARLHTIYSPIQPREFQPFLMGMNGSMLHLLLGSASFISHVPFLCRKRHFDLLICVGVRRTYRRHCENSEYSAAGTVRPLRPTTWPY